MAVITLRLAQWLAKQKHKKFQWGKNDCCTMVLAAHDHMYRTNTLSIAYDKYNTAKGAYKFARELGIQDYARKIGYRQVELPPQDGDLIMVEHKLGYYLHIVLNECIYSMDPQVGMVKAKLNTLTDTYTLWRF